jgi:hypothetical protein
MRDPDWMSKHAEYFIRAYSKARLSRQETWCRHPLFGQYGRNRNFDVNRTSESEPNSQEIINTYIVETNPFFNFKFDKGYIDFGLLIEEEYSPMKNIHNAWNESTGSEEEGVLWNSSPYIGWTQPWNHSLKGMNCSLPQEAKLFIN